MQKNVPSPICEKTAINNNIVVDRVIERIN